MIPRENVYRTYWEFAAKRQEVFFARFYGNPTPWTTDPILSEYKFCCTYRASDRVSQFLIKSVIYDGVQRSIEDIVFRILLFKIFNQISTWELIKSHFGEVCFRDFDYESCATLLARHQSLGNPIYNNAYMSCATKAFGFDQKHRNHLALIQQMNHKDRIANKIATADSLRDVFQLFKDYPLIGNFMAYQLAIDINYSEVIDFSEDSFTIVGPGSERGIKKCFSDIGKYSMEDVIHWMTDNQEREFRRFEINFADLWGRRLYAIDCQGLFCETDKYSRVSFPELKSNRKRIKARHFPNQKRIPFFYPPKWGINERIKISAANHKPQSEPVFELTG